MPNERLGAIQDRKRMSSHMFHMSCVDTQFVSVNEDRNSAIITSDLQADEL
jgi:hypothetical protein